jgi:hypothetical protein
MSNTTAHLNSRSPYLCEQQSLRGINEFSPHCVSSGFVASPRIALFADMLLFSFYHDIALLHNIARLTEY